MVFFILVFLCFFPFHFLNCEDWPQLQHDSQRTGRSSDTVLPPFKLKWQWTSGVNGFTIAEGVQAVVAENKVFLGDMEGTAYAVDAGSGTTIWQADNPGGTIMSCVYADGKVVFGNIDGSIRCFNAGNGVVLWTVKTEGAITSAPVTDGNVVCVGSHDRHVYCINIQDGTVKWVSEDLGAQVVGSLAMDSDTVYTGAENMVFYALKLSDGSIRASKKIQGQSFYQQWPVIYSSYVFIEAAPIPCIGSEYVGEEVMSSASNSSDESLRWKDFLQNINAPYRDASPDWKHLTVLKRDDFSEPFIVSVAPFEGCGTPPEPPVVDNQGRVLTYFKTNFPALVSDKPFGTNYYLDISAINLNYGTRVPIITGTPISDMPNWETDNCYGMSIGGNILYLRQSFRGNMFINLSNSTGGAVPETRGGPSSSQNSIDSARVAPAVANNCLYITEHSNLSCIDAQ